MGSLAMIVTSAPGLGTASRSISAFGPPKVVAQPRNLQNKEAA
jgi:hypothetical protein